MKKQMKRIGKTAVFLAAAIGILAVSAGAAQEVAAAEKEVTELDWYINYSWFQTEWGRDAVSKKITEETGTAVNFLTPSGNEVEKLKLLVSSDSLPDLITIGWWEPMADVMIEKDMLFSLNELADAYEPAFWQWANPEIVKMHTKEDGKLYGYPNSCCLPEDYEKHENISSNQSFLVRGDIYRALGNPDMTTPEGFYEAVKKAAELFPEVDGEPLIPIGAHVFDNAGCDSFDLYLQNFLAVPYEKDGKYYDRYTDPDYIEWLKMFRKLGEEGYLKSDIFIDQRTQMEEKIARGQYFCMLYQWKDMEDQQKRLYEKHRERMYLAVDGPKNRRGDDPVLTAPGAQGWTLTYVSKKCKNPDKAIQLMTYLMSEEGQRLTSLGIEGVTYETENGQAKWKPGVEWLMETDRAAYDKQYGADNTYWMMQNIIMQLDWMPELGEPVQQLLEWSYPYVKYCGQYEVYLSPGTEAGNADMNIKELWGRTLPQLLLAKSEAEFNRLMGTFISERERLGFEKVIKETTAKVEKAKAQLGIKNE